MQLKLACCRNGSPPIPAETGRRYFEHSALTELFRPQVETDLLRSGCLKSAVGLVIVAIAALLIIVAAFAWWVAAMVVAIAAAEGQSYARQAFDNRRDPHDPHSGVRPNGWRH